MTGSLEDRIRRIVRLRATRGRRVAVAQAAGHRDGSWVTNWLDGRQKHATIDEIAAMLTELGVDLAKAVATPDVNDDLDWEALAVMGQVPTERKALALRMLRSLLGRGAEPLSIPQADPRPHRATRKEPGKR